MSSIEQQIQEKALSLGYESCGIVPKQAMESYAERFNERIQKVPASERFYQTQQRLANPFQEFAWAKSVVVLVTAYGKYKIPEHLKGSIGKSFLFDTRIDVKTSEFRNSIAMEKYMQELGLRIATNRMFGLIGLRWAAMQAGLGIIRKNNFFYTRSGSWVSLEAWLTDREMELVGSSSLPPCPQECNRCITACPTASLSSAYTMLPNSCVSFLTTFGGRDLPNEPLAKKFGKCVYGCDVCQNVCPLIENKWEETEDFPGVAELSPYLTAENILRMEDKFYREKVQPKFFYLSLDDLWKWKVNALCFMRNNYKEEYKPYIIAACVNENVKTREMAQSIHRELFG